jgi:hypothetical protein
VLPRRPRLATAAAWFMSLAGLDVRM